MDDQTAAMLRGKTNAERWRMSCNLFAYMRRTIASRLRQDHPDWSLPQIDEEIARRFARANGYDIPR